MSSFHINTHGYTLIVTVVVMATILVMIATVSARRVQDAFFAFVDLSQQTRAQALAEGCVEIALLHRSIEVTYAGNETIPIGNATCTILPITGNIIEVTGVFEQRYYHLRIEVSPELPLRILDWQRVSSL